MRKVVKDNADRQTTKLDRATGLDMRRVLEAVLAGRKPKLSVPAKSRLSALLKRLPSPRPRPEWLDRAETPDEISECPDCECSPMGERYRPCRCECHDGY